MRMGVLEPATERYHVASVLSAGRLHPLGQAPLVQPDTFGSAQAPQPLL